MTKVAWTTDMHLSFLSDKNARKYLRKWNEEEFDILLISGDIGQGNSLIKYLSFIDELIDNSVYFILGNHDYYYSSFAKVNEEIENWFKNNPDTQLHLLGKGEIHQLSLGMGLIGHGGWADGRYGDYFNSEVMLNDYLQIEDFTNLRGESWKNPLLGILANFYNSICGHRKIKAAPKEKIYELLNKLGDESASYFKNVLPKALRKYDNIILLTHVPPFREACTYKGKPTKRDYLPHFSCKAVGDAINEIMREHPKKSLTVLCGHTHGGARVEMGDNKNIFVKAGQLTGRAPDIQEIFKV